MDDLLYTESAKLIDRIAVLTKTVWLFYTAVLPECDTHEARTWARSQIAEMNAEISAKSDRVLRMITAPNYSPSEGEAPPCRN